MTPMTAKAGDWIRFWQGDKMVIGVVQYVRQRDTYPSWKDEALTDRGACDLEKILETRSPEKASVEVPSPSSG